MLISYSFTVVNVSYIQLICFSSPEFVFGYSKNMYREARHLSVIEPLYEYGRDEAKPHLTIPKI